MTIRSMPVTLYDNRFSVHLDSPLYNGPLTRATRHSVGFTQIGCAYRGTTTCYRCPFEPVMECDYRCSSCNHRHECHCGHEQTHRLQAWGVVP